MHKALGLILHMAYNYVVTHSYNLSTGEEEMGESEVQVLHYVANLRSTWDNEVLAFKNKKGKTNSYIITRNFK